MYSVERKACPESLSSARSCFCKDCSGEGCEKRFPLDTAACYHPFMRLWHPSQIKGYSTGLDVSFSARVGHTDVIITFLHSAASCSGRICSFPRHSTGIFAQCMQYFVHVDQNIRVLNRHPRDMCNVQAEQADVRQADSLSQ